MNNERICTICKIVKPFSDFNWDKRFNLPFSRCKKCYNEKCRKYRASKEAKEVYRKWLDNGGQQLRNKALFNHKLRHRDRYMARYTLKNAIRDKKIVKQPCEICQDPKSEGHHKSYQKENWLNITWLCKKHHIEATYNIFI